jgi:polysaccharide biosynthesis/export protein
MRISATILVLSVLLLPVTGVADEAVIGARAAYRLQPGDVVAVSVWKESELQREVLVRPDGALTFPLAGEIDVDGKTVEQLRVDLVERLSSAVRWMSCRH